MNWRNTEYYKCNSGCIGLFWWHLIRSAVPHSFRQGLGGSSWRQAIGTFHFINHTPITSHLGVQTVSLSLSISLRWASLKLLVATRRKLNTQWHATETVLRYRQDSFFRVDGVLRGSWSDYGVEASIGLLAPRRMRKSSRKSGLYVCWDSTLLACRPDMSIPGNLELLQLASRKSIHSQTWHCLNPRMLRESLSASAQYCIISFGKTKTFLYCVWLVNVVMLANVIAQLNGFRVFHFHAERGIIAPATSNQASASA